MMIVPLPHFAQKPICTFEVEYSKAEKVTGTKFDDYLFIKTEAQSSTYFYMISSLGNLVDSYKTLGDITLLGSTVSETEIRFYFTLPKTKDIHSIFFSRERKRFERYKKIANDIDYTGVAYNEKDFHVLVFDKKNDNLILSKATGDSLSVINKFAIEDKQLIKHFKKNQFSFISDGKEIYLDSARSQNKIYYQNQKILLISDNWDSEEVAETKIITLDLHNDSMNAKNILLPYDNKTGHNSFLYKDKLYVLGIERIIVGLNVYDFPSLNKIAEHRYLKGQPIQFKVSDLIENGKNWDKEWRGKWSDKVIAEQTLRILNKGVPVISVSKADSINDRLLIGRSVLPDKKNIFNTAMAPLPGGGYAQVGNGGRAIFGNNAPLPVDDASFYGYLNRMDFSVPSSIDYKEHGSFYQADRRINKISREVTVGGSGVISSPDGGYLIYLNKKTKSIVLEKF